MDQSQTTLVKLKCISSSQQQLGFAKGNILKEVNSIGMPKLYVLKTYIALFNFIRCKLVF